MTFMCIRVRTPAWKWKLGNNPANAEQVILSRQMLGPVFTQFTSSISPPRPVIHIAAARPSSPAIQAGAHRHRRNSFVYAGFLCPAGHGSDHRPNGRSEWRSRISTVGHR